MVTKKLDPQTQNISTGAANTHVNSTRCDLDVLRARIDAVAQAQKRSRAAFLASTIVSLAILITMWNAYGSWYRSMIFNPKFAEAEVTKEAQKAFVDEWVRSLKVSIPVLGIQAGVGDAAIVGSLSLYIICIWVLLSMRRENHIIGVLLRDTQKCEVPTRTMVFHGIVSFSVFTIVSDFDDPIYDLKQQPRKKRVRFVRGTYKLLILLPAITIGVLFLNDWFSILVLRSPLREGIKPLRELMTGSDWGKRGVMEAICLVLFLLTLYLCVRIIKYNNSTENVLQQYEGIPVEE